MKLIKTQRNPVKAKVPILHMLYNKYDKYDKIFCYKINLMLSHFKDIYESFPAKLVYQWYKVVNVGEVHMF